MSPRHRRANWVGLRTLRQRPKVVGTTGDGEPVYEVRSVRLLLQGQSAHFSRLVPCERCGRDQAGSTVLSPADLEAPPRPVICADCVRSAGVTSVWEREAARPPTGRPAPRAPKPAEPTKPVAAPPAHGERLASLEKRLQTVGERVAELGRLAVAQQATLDERRQSEEAALAGLRAAIAQVAAEVTSVAEGNAGRIATFESQLRDSVTGLAKLIDAQREDLSALVAAMDRARSEIGRLAEADTRLAQAQHRVEERAAAAAAAEAPSWADHAASLDHRVEELGARLSQVMARIDALEDAAGQRDGRLGALEARVDGLVDQRATPPEGNVPAAPLRDGAHLLDALERQLQGASSRLAELSGGAGRTPGPDEGNEPGVTRLKAPRAAPGGT